MPQAYSLTFADERLELRADRTLWWPAQEVLFLADLHAGKAEHMQRAGLRVPSGNLQADLDRLQRAVNELRPKRVIVLGDLFHSDINNEWQMVVAWSRQQNCSVELVRGNHDRFISDATFTEGGLVVYEENVQLGPFTLRHHPLSNDAEFSESTTNKHVLCGHVHPVFTVFGAGGDQLRMPCFVVTDKQVVLPAYGSFTGGYKVSRASTNLLVCTGPDFETILPIH